MFTQYYKAKIVKKNYVDIHADGMMPCLCPYTINKRCFFKQHTVAPVLHIDCVFLLMSFYILNIILLVPPEDFIFICKLLVYFYF